MKKKSPRGIPDFSRKPASKSPFTKITDDKQQPIRPVVAPRIKPPSTSSKSGRRGS
jgi:hypothetical protein